MWPNSHCSANRWTGFYMIKASVMKGLTWSLNWSLYSLVEPGFSIQMRQYGLSMFSLFAVYTNKHNELNYYIFELLNYFISNEFDKINCKSYLPKTLNIPHYCKHSSATCFRPYVTFSFSEVYWKSFWNCNIFIAFIRLHSCRPTWPSNIQDWAPCYIV